RTLATDSPSTTETRCRTSSRRRASGTFAWLRAPRGSGSSCAPSARSSCRSVAAPARGTGWMLGAWSSDAHSPREGIRDVEGVRELQDDAGEEAILVVPVQECQLHAVVLVDHDDAPEGYGILRSGYPVAHDDEVVVHLDVTAHHRPPGVAGPLDAGHEPDAAQFDVAVVGTELLIGDLLVVERLARDQVVAGREPDAELLHADGGGRDPVVLVDRPPLEVQLGPVVLLRVDRRDVEPGFHLPRQPELALPLHLRRSPHRQVGGDIRVAVRELEGDLLVRQQVRRRD